MSKGKWTKPKTKYDGWVYIIKIWAPKNTVYKIGTTNRLVKTRILEIVGELWEVLGHIPKIELLRQKQTKDNYKIESEVLNKTQNHRCSLGFCEWVGESELRKMDEYELLQTYDRVVAEGFAPTKKFEVSL